MKTCLIAAALVLLPTAAMSAEDCKWYVHEKDKAMWIEDRGDSLVVNPSDGGPSLQYEIKPIEGRPFVKQATWMNSGGHLETFLFRFIEWNGERVLVADMDVYFQTCERPKLPPV